MGVGVVIPDHVCNEVRRILDAEARRLLAEQLDGDAVSPAARRHMDAFDHGLDQSAPRSECQALPVAASDLHREAGAA